MPSRGCWSDALPIQAVAGGGGNRKTHDDLEPRVSELAENAVIEMSALGSQFLPIPCSAQSIGEGLSRRDLGCDAVATQRDVRRIALSLPATIESKDRFAFSVPVKGKEKGYAWVWMERVEPGSEPRRARRPRS